MMSKLAMKNMLNQEDVMVINWCGKTTQIMSVQMILVCKRVVLLGLEAGPLWNDGFKKER